LIAPERETAIVRALVDLYRHEHWLPDARQGNYNGRTQGGSNADMVIADAYTKHLPGIDWKTAYQAVLNDAERPPWDGFKEGRGGVDDWKRRGFLSVESVDRPGSKQMEYAANDYAAALLAKDLGQPGDFEKYLKRAGNWSQLWDASVKDEGFSGFIRPRHDDGSWLTPFSTRQQCSFYGNSFYEGDSWTYSLYVPQDIRKLMDLSGGKARFVERLDQFFKGRHYDVTNEPGFLTPYLYIWAGRHDKTAERIRQIVTDDFKPTPDGLPGNDDSGAMSSWYIFSSIGIFPNAGQDVYLVGSPLFRKTTIKLPGGKTFTIEAHNVSAENKYVRSASLNGKVLRSAWFRHTDIAAGGKLVLEMADHPSSWPDGPPPPSMSDSNEK
jgi:predicted alpha-1,2-mannosidase